MHKLYELKDMICEELDAYAGKDLTRDSLDVIDKLAHSGKNIAKLIHECEGSSYAMPDGSYDGSMAGYRSYYDEGGANGMATPSFRRSMARGRRGAMRDSMGRYSGEGYSRNSDYAERLKKMAMGLPENMKGEILRMADEMASME